MAPVAAGADIKEMSKLTFADAYGQDKFNEWARLGKIRKPVRNAGHFSPSIMQMCAAVVRDRGFYFRALLLLCVTCSCLIDTMAAIWPEEVNRSPHGRTR